MQVTTCQPVPGNLLSYEPESLIFSLNHLQVQFEHPWNNMHWMHYITSGVLSNLQIAVLWFKLRIGNMGESGVYLDKQFVLFGVFF